ncbi:hypothetical protein ESCO_000876 [Escovopsis weberi]|uniref:Uncharacterized protein n=1 Tax=Escovopsis weberi TaxID=150374 RepID=A0A0M9VU72_ESCWE|nr:hypothetical protein ESCO_000876 [Escovopsis weberi]
MATETDMRRIRATSEGSGLARPSTWESATSPTLVNVYARKPLPPLPSVQNSPLKGSPVPAPLNVRKNPSRQNNQSPRSSPSSNSSTSPKSVGYPSIETGRAVSAATPSPTKGFGHDAPATSPNRPSSRRSTVSTNPARKSGSKKVLQLIGQDVDVMLGGAAQKREHHPSNPLKNPSNSLKKKPSRSSSSGSMRGFDLISPNLHIVSRIPEEDAVPGLEADKDGVSSHHSSMLSMSPQALTPGSAKIDRAFRDVECDGSQHCYCPLHQDAAALDAEELADTDVLGEYHKFAAELAASTESPTSSPAAEAAESRVKRMSNFLSFSANAQFSRRRNRPNSIEPHPAHKSLSRSASGGLSGGSSSAPVPSTVSEQPELSPDAFLRPRTGIASEHGANASPNGAMVRPHSAFDADSEDERKGRSRWRRDRARDESVRPRAWSKTGDQMRDLLTSAKDKARGLPVSKAEKRRELLRSEIRVLAAA